VNESRRELLQRYADGADEVDRALDAITPEGLDRRPSNDGWTARQVVHHLADSESMAYIRLRRLIAEDSPAIQGYDEPEYARRLHYDRPIEPSLAVLRAVRGASLQLLRSLSPDEWERAGTHSESGPYSVDAWLSIYADHPRDHAAQIRAAATGDLGR
jgi:DinB superfamily